MGSKKSFLIAVALVGLGAAACVNGDATEGQVEEALTNAGLDDASATCVAGQLSDENNLSQEQFNDVASADDIDDLADQRVEGGNQRLDNYVVSVLEQCHEDPEAEPEGGADGEDEPGTDTEGDTGTTEAPE